MERTRDFSPSLELMRMAVRDTPDPRSHSTLDVTVLFISDGQDNVTGVAGAPRPEGAFYPTEAIYGTCVRQLSCAAEVGVR